jgi:hypothetical protein
MDFLLALKTPGTLLAVLVPALKHILCKFPPVAHDSALLQMLAHHRRCNVSPLTLGQHTTCTGHACHVQQLHQQQPSCAPAQE